MKRNPSYRNPSTRQKSPPSSNLEVSSDGPKRAPSRRRLWEQSPETENAMSSREKERQELRKNQSLRKPPSSHHDDYENDHDDRPDRARSMRGDRLNRARSARGENYNDHYKEERYEPKRYDDRYNDHGRDDRYQDRYEDRYREDRHREDRHREDHYREERHYREEAPSRSKSYREEPPSRSKSYKREPLPALAPERHDDRGYYDRPRSPPRHYKERSYDREPAYSDRYTDRNDLDDYYYDSAPRHQIPPVSRERARREPSVRSGRYGKDANYF